MKTKSVKCILGILIMSLLFSGCTLVDLFSAETLLKAPKLTGENAALQASFEEAVGTDIGLFTPLSGEYRASYILFDANFDGEEEAIVFYSLNSNKSVIHMHLLTKHNGTWHSVADVIGSGTGVYKVDFFNIDESSELEIAVMWSADDSKRDKTLSLYKINSLTDISGDNLTSLATILVSDYVNIDLDNDAADELLYMYYSLNDDIHLSGVRLMDYDIEQGSLVPLSEIAFDIQIYSYVNIQSEKSEDGYRFYLDCLLSNNTYITELIFYSFEMASLTVPQFDAKTLWMYTHRSTNVFCEDFDKDGKLDVPVEVREPTVNIFGVPNEEKVTMEVLGWVGIEDEKLNTIGTYIFNTTDGYLFKIDEYIDGNYFTYDYQNKILQVRNNDSYSDENILFTITNMTVTANNSVISGERSGNTKIVVNVTEVGKALGLVESEIERNIIIR